MNLSEMVAMERGEQVGWTCKPHLDRRWIDFFYDEWVPIGTCPECVEAAMHDAVHVLWEPKYEWPMTRLKQGVLAGLLEQSHLMKLIPWSSCRDE